VLYLNKMKKLNGIIVKGLDFNPKKMGDLLYCEGPLLSHFQDIEKSNEHYFFRWVDNDDDTHRWLIFKATDKELLSFFNKSISLRKLIEKNTIVTLLDLDDDLNKKSIIISSIDSIPDNYLPSENSFFNENRFENYATELKEKLETKYMEESIIIQLFRKVTALEDQQKKSFKLLNKMALTLQNEGREPNFIKI